MADEASATAAAVILIVEDEPLLRELAVEIVEGAGFVALQAGDAEQAIALLETHADIAVLFTDVNMPGCRDGLELAQAVRERWPPIKILVVSGQVRLQPSDLPSNSAFLRKPYRGAAVIAQLCSLLVPDRTSTSDLTFASSGR
jgi:CheY-like chemotaxis protein